VQRIIEVLAGPALADCGSLEDEQRNGQQRDAGQFLVNILGDGIERGHRHEHQHEQRRHAAEGEGDGNAGEQRKQRRTAI
jgi:hypothetical protein